MVEKERKKKMENKPEGIAQISIERHDYLRGKEKEAEELNKQVRQLKIQLRNKDLDLQKVIEAKKNAVISVERIDVSEKVTSINLESVDSEDIIRIIKSAFRRVDIQGIYNTLFAGCTEKVESTIKSVEIKGFEDFQSKIEKEVRSDLQKDLKRNDGNINGFDNFRSEVEKWVRADYEAEIDRYDIEIKELQKEIGKGRVKNDKLTEELKYCEVHYDRINSLYSIAERFIVNIERLILPNKPNLFNSLRIVKAIKSKRLDYYKERQKEEENE